MTPTMFAATHISPIPNREFVSTAINMSLMIFLLLMLCAKDERQYPVYVLIRLISCIIIISSLAAFTILSVRFLYIPTNLQRDAEQLINTSTVTARQVACVLPRSGQYCICQRYVYYALLIAAITITIVFKKDRGLWLASGAAATALLYSGVAAVHQMLLFGFGLRTQRYSTCEPFPLPGRKDSLPVCYGLDDLDRDTACIIVGAGLLAILPMAAWSLVFKLAAARPILVLWMLLMASSHVFCAVSRTETTVHYQICPTGLVEDLPGSTYVAGELDDAWRTRYSDIASNRSRTLASSAGICMYSCFNPHGYPLRAGRGIAVLDNSKSALNQRPSLPSRRLGVAFWFIYLAFSIVALLELLHESGFWRPFDVVLRPLHHWYPWLKQDINTRAAWHKFRKNNPQSRTCTRLLIHVIIHFPRFLSAVMFIGYIVFLEVTHWDAPESEPFAAVGQFGAVVVVLLVAFATFFSRLTERPGKGDGSSSSSSPNEGFVELSMLPAQQGHMSG